jgi:anthranilate phosphoribosyltransferase
MSTPAQAVAAEQATMRSIIQRIATGPELSKDIAFEEARAGMRQVLSPEADPVQTAIFLIALRMKRETDDENRGVLAGIIDVAERATAAVDEVVDVADPYDGYNRTLPASPFLPPVLAALGVPAITHGVETVGPKFGVTARQVLRAAGESVDLTPQQAAQRIADRGWAYVDQAQYCRPLHDLIDLRTRMVKRQAITTVEVLVGPVRGRRKTHLVTGYVHKPYPRIYALLARQAGFDSALLVRGVEGGVVPSLRQPGKLFFYHDMGEEQSVDTDPTALGISSATRAVPIPDDIPRKPGMDAIDTAVDSAAVAEAAARAGREALEGRSGPTRDSLVYAAANVLWHLRRYDSLSAAADAVRAVLDDGKARERLEG